MDAEIDLIADAVKAELLTLLPQWGQPTLVPQVVDQPEFDAKQLHGLHLSIVPVQTTTTLAARGAGDTKKFDVRHELVIDIRKRTSNDAVSGRAVRRLVELNAEYWLHGRKPTTYAAAACLGSEAGVLYQGEKLVASGIYVGQVTVHFQTLRTRRAAEGEA